MRTRSSSRRRVALTLAAAAGIGGLVLATRAARRHAARASLHGRVVVIVGGTRGLGLAMARRFVALGCPVAICGRDEETAERARLDLIERGGTVVAASCDATDEAEVARFLDLVLANLGRVDVLITCAATIGVGPIESMTTRDFQEAMESIFWSSVNPTLAVLPIMRGHGGGRIAHVTSIGGRIPIPHLLAYSAAKFAEVGFSEGLHAEVAKDGIAVTTIVPGLMRTGSYVRAHYHGDVVKEQAWFGSASIAPAISMDADRAASQMVDAIAAKRGRVIVGMPARAAIAAYELFPGTTSRALAVTERALPAAPADPTVEHRVVFEESEEERTSVRAVQQAGRVYQERYQHMSR
ncbi:SDR family NAD(P)-dependent oxidoreductase [Sandaracinus amylolyticus]|uniref:SDR family NAD(P)-dependent oxidoreductase n=1 Tax=Sandaracinus amylolyticus TaxID=927083 RepID=UPI001F264285|nr:SDR family oxidoreductase [Sandaracinus amylolyticus]UJR79706.1 Short-subunit dehydrogenase [Sandaracinus amylolyticus]